MNRHYVRDPYLGICDVSFWCQGEHSYYCWTGGYEDEDARRIVVSKKDIIKEIDEGGDMLNLLCVGDLVRYYDSVAEKHNYMFIYNEEDLRVAKLLNPDEIYIKIEGNYNFILALKKDKRDEWELYNYREGEVG